MHGFVLFIFFIGTAGPEGYTRGYTSIEECESMKAAVIQQVKVSNAKGDGPRVDFLAMACAPVEKAPRGRDA